jgi:hypothetical protein
VRWLWAGWIPLAKLTVLDGDPGLGKSTLLLDLAARLTRGHLLPDGSLGLDGAVTLVTAEDGLADTIRPRLEAAKADLERVHVLRAVADRGGSRPPAIPADLDLLHRILDRTGSRLLILDPFLAFLGGGVDSCKDQDVRRCVHRLADLAAQTACAVVLLRHLNKGRSDNALYRGTGSIGIIGAARAGLLVARDPASTNHRILAVTKSNLAAPPMSLRFRLEPATGEVCRVVWCGPCQHDADGLIRSAEPSIDRACLHEAMLFLQDLLAAGPLPADECLRNARAAGLSEKTLRRAKTYLHIHSLRESQGHTGRWLWALPLPSPLPSGESACLASASCVANAPPAALAASTVHSAMSATSKETASSNCPPIIPLPRSVGDASSA